MHDRDMSLSLHLTHSAQLLLDTFESVKRNTPYAQMSSFHPLLVTVQASHAVQISDHAAELHHLQLKNAALRAGLPPNLQPLFALWVHGLYGQHGLLMLSTFPLSTTSVLVPIYIQTNASSLGA